jgi:hypothetical protein
MSVIGSNLIAGASGQGGGYNLTNSLRFRSSASASLTRTPATSGLNQTKTTLSVWVKRGVLGGTQQIYGARTGANATYTLFYFQDDGLRFLDSQGASLITTPVFRDPSAWYHLVLSIDTTQATASNRVKIYVNGVQITAFSTATYPTQNAVLAINYFNIAQNIGQQASSQYFDGYMAEFHDIDGQALTPSSFGATSATTGVWQPIRYAGTYGTNGFYLPFTDNSALTTSSNVGLGKDFSGNGNYWTTNNISITAGATYDSMTDVPTLTSATEANYATLNPIAKSSFANISSGNLNISWSDNASAQLAANAATMALPSSGKWYFELSNASADGNNAIGVGICDVTQIANNNNATPSTYYLYRSDANNNFIGYQSNTGNTGGYTSFLGGTAVVGIAVDLDNGKFWAAVNNTWQGGGNPATGTSPAYSGISNSVTWIPFVGGWEWTGTATSAVINFGQRPFSYTPPTGFNRLNTFNLPTPTIGATASTLANKNFDVTTYTGNGSTLAITNSGGMQPDFVWGKSRSLAQQHLLFDSVRGVGNFLQSQATAAEGFDATTLSSFNSNGFTLGSNITINTNASTNVAWQWRANGSAVTNTAGSISSQVSANTSAGFSVVTYTGTGANATVGHGLGVAPRMVIAKNRTSGAPGWPVYHASVGNTGALVLNSTSTPDTSSSYWNNTSPTSSVVSIGTGTSVNTSTQNYVMYCFAEVAGYSAFGSYTGNGSADGPFVFTGFRPRFVMIKRTDSGGFNWVIVDTARDPINVTGNLLLPNTSGAEASAPPLFDYLSNGFKLRDSGTGLNGSGGTYIYMAFAESPFKFANAR